jgi:hypothetical protein
MKSIITDQFMINHITKSDKKDPIFSPLYRALNRWPLNKSPRGGNMNMMLDNKICTYLEKISDLI